ncbi:hypothetical protein SLEP1_g9899 [Rubroshorea leprosula]|uniref:Rhodanese-like domain-containing protein 4, chloroplastic n=1 Tax=Rubroshorea leprosula TaxID=152421 RepID=A0AAV5IC31_9ROSI|nr:hypothetical protein SLEP1_g9899 [Rubroshorea leprosula]
MVAEGSNMLWVEKSVPHFILMAIFKNIFLCPEEALQQSTASSGSEVESSGVLDTVVGFVTENPAIVASGAAILVLPIVLSQVFGKSKPWGKELREVGSPDVRGLGKKPVSIVYKGDDKPGFLKKLSLKFKKLENTTLFILGKFDGNSELVAELVAINGFKAAYAIKDGAEGPRGWMNSGLPWIPPKKALSLDLSSLTESISGELGEGSEALPVTLAIAAATGLGLLAFTEIETILQLLGSAAIIQLLGKKLLFAEANENRKQTLQQVDEFLNTKVAPKELVDELKQIGKALLPSSVNGEALPAPAEANPEPAKMQKAEPAPLTTEPKVEAVAERSPQINSVAKTEATAESVSGFPKPLSPYPYYPDLKPPTSPSPSQP